MFSVPRSRQYYTSPLSPNHFSNASADSQRKWRLPPISWLKCFPNWLVFLHISCAPSPLLGGHPISLYLLIIDSGCKLGAETSKQSQRSLCGLEGAPRVAGVKVESRDVNLTRRPLFKADLSNSLRRLHGAQQLQQDLL